MDRWYSVEDVAEHLGVARDTVYRWIGSRSLPAHRVGRLWKFKLSEVDEWVRSGGADETVSQNQSDERRQSPVANKTFTRRGTPTRTTVPKRK